VSMPFPAKYTYVTRSSRSIHKQLEPPTKKEPFERIITLKSEEDVLALWQLWNVVSAADSLMAPAARQPPTDAPCIIDPIVTNEPSHSCDDEPASNGEAEGATSTLSTLLKFPRTSHAVNLGSASRDDKILGRAALEGLLNVSSSCGSSQHTGPRTRLIVEEKLDGANMGISIVDNCLCIQNRSHYITHTYHPQFAPLQFWLSQHSHELWNILQPEGSDTGKDSHYILYGEWLYATHSVKYNSLPGWFVAYDMLDRVSNTFLGRERVEQLLVTTTIPIAPLILSGEKVDVRVYLFYLFCCRGTVWKSACRRDCRSTT
jgi:hypothetical protein